MKKDNITKQDQFKYWLLIVIFKLFLKKVDFSFLSEKCLCSRQLFEGFPRNFSFRTNSMSRNLSSLFDSTVSFEKIWLDCLTTVISEKPQNQSVATHLHHKVILTASKNAMQFQVKVFRSFLCESTRSAAYYQSAFLNAFDSRVSLAKCLWSILGLTTPFFGFIMWRTLDFYLCLEKFYVEMSKVNKIFIDNWVLERMNGVKKLISTQESDFESKIQKCFQINQFTTPEFSHEILKVG